MLKIPCNDFKYGPNNPKATKHGEKTQLLVEKSKWRGRIKPSRLKCQCQTLRCLHEPNGPLTNESLASFSVNKGTLSHCPQTEQP